MFSFFNKHQSPLKACINGETIELQAKETLLQAALRHEIDFPHSCRVGGCATCKCQLTEGKVKELTDSGYILSADELEQGYILACQSVPQSDVVIHLPQAVMPQQKVQGEISAHRQLTNDIAEITVALDRTLEYRPGQYINFSLQRLPHVQRSYSFATARAENKEVRFIVRHMAGGQLSPLLNSDSCVGEAANLQGPLGEFYLRPAHSPILMVATGSGLAPILSMLEAEAQNARHRPVTLLFGARTQQDLYAQERLQGIQTQWQERFEYLPTLSREDGGSSWPGECGRVTEIQAQLDIDDHHAYLCGSPAMVDEMESLLIDRGIARQYIHADRFLTQHELANDKAAGYVTNNMQ